MPTTRIPPFTTNTYSNLDYLSNIPTSNMQGYYLAVMDGQLTFPSGFQMPIESFEAMCKLYLQEHEPEQLV